MWIARDKSGHLQMFNRKPHKDEGAFWVGGASNALLLPKYLFPEITFENSPKQVELKLIKTV